MSRNAKLIVAFCLGIVGFFLMFALGEASRILPWLPATLFWHNVEFTVLFGAYFVLCAFGVARRAALRQDWPIPFALLLPILIVVAAAAIVEPNKSAVLEGVLIALWAVACTVAGVWLGRGPRAARG